MHELDVTDLLSGVNVGQSRVDFALVEIPEHYVVSPFSGLSDTGKQADAKREVRAKTEALDRSFVLALAELEQDLVVEKVKKHDRAILEANCSHVNHWTLLDAGHVTKLTDCLLE